MLDQKLTCRSHITAKKTQIKHKLRQMCWLIGRKSNLTTENKLLMYKATLKPIRSYGVQLWAVPSRLTRKSYEQYNQKY